MFAESGTHPRVYSPPRKGNMVMVVVLMVLAGVLLYMPFVDSILLLHVTWFGLGLCTATLDTGCQIMTRKVHGIFAGPWLGLNTVCFAIAGALDVCQRDLLGWWLCERQTPGGGLNGRPQKEADVCYSWWVLSSLRMLGRDAWIDGGALRAFILKCQDGADGGIADKPGNEADVFHTFFGIAGLAFLGADGVLPVEPMHAMPVATNVLDRLVQNIMKTEIDAVATRVASMANGMSQSRCT